MSAVGTSREAVERLALGVSLHGNLWIDAGPQASDTPHGPVIAATLRALLAEREVALRDAAAWKSAAHTAGNYREEERARAETAEAERDLARAEVARLRGVVEVFVAADDHWLKGNKGGEWAHRMSIARELARAALAEPTP